MLLLLPALLISACGKGVVDVTRQSYEPKIVIEGLLIAARPIGKIHITRNFPVDANLRTMSLIEHVEETIVTVTEVATGRKVTLEFRGPSGFGSHQLKDYYWTDSEAALIIEHGKSYRLDVSMPIEGKVANASAITHVPEAGMAIKTINYNSLPYRAEDESGELQQFTITLQRSPGVNFYMTTIEAQNAVLDSLILDNAFEEIDIEEAIDDLDEYAYEVEWIQNTPTTPGESFMHIYWNALYFYGDYKLTVFGADYNYAQFLQTYDEVQEMDGNFHEPYFNIDGDGIGYFGSAVVDTININVSR